MKKFVLFIVRLIIRDYNNIHDQRVRSKYGLLEGWMSIIVNFLLFLIKGIIGITTSSIALIADALHTMSDIATSVVIVGAFRASKKPSDREHPFGHGRMEPVATVVVAVLLIVVGVELFKNSIERIVNPKPFDSSWGVIGVIGVTVIIKELLARFSRELGRMIKSKTLEADFWHHRTDAISSVIVIVAFIGERIGLVNLDGIAGLMVSVMVAYAGWKIVKTGTDDLLGKRPSEDLIMEVKETAREFPEVLNIHEVIIHEYGKTLVLSFHIQIPEHYSLKKAHALSDQVANAIDKRFSCHSTVHIDPINLNDSNIKEYRQFLENIVDKEKDIIEYHDLRITGRNREKTIYFDIVVCPESDEKNIDHIKSKITKKFLKKFPSLKSVTIEIEPKYAH
jgi:cation diffusion facilitator family transporter